MKLVEKLLDYYEKNPVDFENDIEELNNCTGCLYDHKIYPMNELNKFFSNKKPDEIIRWAFYGYDNSYKKPLPFNPNREYFYFNGYGNLVSIDKKDYSDYLDEAFVQDIIDNSYNLSLSSGAEDIINNY